MDNQDQEYGGGGARKKGRMNVRSEDGVIISDETTAEEETVDGATSVRRNSEGLIDDGGTVDLALTLMTGARNDDDGAVDLTVPPVSPDPAGSSRSVSEDGRTLNLIESLTGAPEAAESSGGARNNSGSSGGGGERNNAGILDFVNIGVVAVGNPGSAFSPVRAEAAAVDNESPPVQEQSPLINVLQDSDQSNSTNDKKLDDGGKNSSEVAGKSPLIITGSEESQRMGKAEAVGQSSSRHNEKLAGVRGGRYSQTSGGGHNSSIAVAAATATLPPLPPPPPQRDEYVCRFCNRTRFSSIVLLEEHMRTCPRRVINLD